MNVFPFLQHAMRVALRDWTPPPPCDWEEEEEEEAKEAETKAVISLKLSIKIASGRYPGWKEIK